MDREIDPTQLDWSIEAYFIHRRLIFGMVDKRERPDLAPFIQVDSRHDHLTEMAIEQQFTDAACRHFHKVNVPPLRSLMINEGLVPGHPVWHEGRFAMRGPKVSSSEARRNHVKYSLTDISSNRIGPPVRIPFGGEHIIDADSAIVNLGMRSARLFVLGYCVSSDSTRVEIRPALIGRRVIDVGIRVPYEEPDAIG